MTCGAARMVPGLDGRHFWYSCQLDAGHEGDHETTLRWT